MERLNLTNEFIKSYPKPDSEKEIYDKQLENLAVRIRPTGYKSFIYRYYVDGSKRYTIGKFPEWDIERARQEAKELYQKVQQGIDLNAEKNRKEKANQSITVKEAIERFKEIKFPELSEATQRLYGYHFDNYLSEIHDVNLANLTKSDVLPIMDNYAEVGKRRTANDIRTALSTLLTFSTSRGWIDENFVTDIQTYKEKNDGKRDRFYSFDEIVEIWKQIKQFNEPVRTFYKILFLTGQRKGETLKMQWKHLNSSEKIWTIPASLAKNDVKHVVPLSDNILDMLEQLYHDHSGNSDFVFKSNVRKNQPVKTVHHQVKKIKNNTSVSDFRNHDIRRTMITHMASIGIDESIVSRIVNHKMSENANSITREVYNKYEYLEEKREALQAWNNKLFDELKKGKIDQLVDATNADKDINISAVTYYSESEGEAVEHIESESKEGGKYSF